MKTLITVARREVEVKCSDYVKWVRLCCVKIIVDTAVGKLNENTSIKIVHKPMNVLLKIQSDI